MARRAWTLIAAGTAVYWGGLIAASADVPLALSLLPLIAGAALTMTAGVAGARDPQRRPERIPFWLAVVVGVLELATVVMAYAYELAGSDSGLYTLPLTLAMLILPVAAAWAASERRFSRSPEVVREPINVRLRRGWLEQTKSWALAWRHRGLLVLPATSILLVTASWYGAYRLAGMWAEHGLSRITLASFLILLPASLIGTYFSVAYLGALDCRLRGHPGAVRDGLRIAWRRRGPIAVWALLAAGVGAVIQGLQQIRSEWAIAPVLAWVGGLAWGLLTVFVLPVLALEDVGVRDAARRAAALVRQRWGEAAGGLGNLMLVSVALTVPLSLAFSVAFIIAAPDRDAMLIVLLSGIAVFLAMFVLIAGCGWAFALALYRYAAGDAAIPPFTEDDLQHALVPRRSLWRRRKK